MAPAADREAFEKLRQRELELVAERGDLFTRYFGLPLSLQITRMFLGAGWGATSASVAMWFTGIIGASLLAFGPWGILAGSAFLLLHHLLDYVDGQLARSDGVASVQGAVIDRWNHFSVEAATYIMLGVGLYLARPGILSFVLPWILFIWNRFRVLIASLSQLIYLNELGEYPRLERKMMLDNLVSRRYELGGDADSPTPSPAATQSPFRALLTRFRTASTSYNFFTIVLFASAALELIAQAAGVDLAVVFYTVAALALYYVLNFLDYSVTYLFGDRIRTELLSLLFRSARGPGGTEHGRKNQGQQHP